MRLPTKASANLLRKREAAESRRGRAERRPDRATRIRGNPPQIACMVIRVGQHVVVRGEDEEAIVTAVHPDSQVEIEFLDASAGGRRRRRYAAEALEVIDGHGEH